MEKITDKIFKYYCDLHNIAYTKQYDSIGRKISYHIDPKSQKIVKRNDLKKMFILFNLRYLVVVIRGNTLHFNLYVPDI